MIDKELYQQKKQAQSQPSLTRQIALFDGAQTQQRRVRIVQPCTIL